MKIIRSKTMKISILKPIFMTILACSLGFWGVPPLQKISK